MMPKTPNVKFLLVDDNPENIVALEALLRRDGLEIMTARSGLEALELLLVHDFALALLDVQMPEMDGFQLAELMRGSVRSRNVPIIFVTAAVQQQHTIFQGYDAGAVDFLFKPIEPRILRHKADTFFQLYKQRQELAETLRLNELFVAAVTHDLRSPLQTVVLATELILDDTNLARGTRAAAERLRNSGRRMTGMIDDLFDLARVRLGEGVALEPEPMTIGSLVTGVVADAQLSAPGRAIELEITGDTAGVWDPRRLAQVAANLIGNALRHGTKSVPVRVGCRGEGARVLLSVRNGGAIDPNARASLFDPFRQRTDAHARKSGLGLGLFIVDQLVRAHRGTIDVDSSEADGTSFLVSLPRAVPG